jgi:hypothetical protein
MIFSSTLKVVEGEFFSMTRATSEIHLFKLPHAVSTPLLGEELLSESVE